MASRIRRFASRLVRESIPSPTNPLGGLKFFNPALLAGDLGARKLYDVSGADDVVSAARDWLTREAPVIDKGLSASRNVRLDHYLLNRGVDAAERGKISDIDVKRDAIAIAKDYNQQWRDTAGIVREPVFAGINRLSGTDSYIDTKTKERRPLGGPFAGNQMKAAEQAASRIDNPVVRGLAKTGIQGIDIATDPRTYIPVGGAASVLGHIVPGVEAGVGKQLLLGGAGIGGFGGKTLSANVLRGGAILGTANLAGELTAEVTDNPLAQIGARFAAPMVGMRPAGAGLRGLGKRAGDERVAGRALTWAANELAPAATSVPANKIFSSEHYDWFDESQIDRYHQLAKPNAPRKPVEQWTPEELAATGDLVTHGTHTEIDEFVKDPELMRNPEIPKGHFFTLNTGVTAKTYAYRRASEKISGWHDYNNSIYRPAFRPKELDQLFDAHPDLAATPAAELWRALRNKYDQRATTTIKAASNKDRNIAAIAQRFNDDLSNNNKSFDKDELRHFTVTELVGGYLASLHSQKLQDIYKERTAVARVFGGTLDLRRPVTWPQDLVDRLRQSTNTYDQQALSFYDSAKQTSDTQPLGYFAYKPIPASPIIQQYTQEHGIGKVIVPDDNQFTDGASIWAPDERLIVRENFGQQHEQPIIHERFNKRVAGSWVQGLSDRVPKVADDIGLNTAVRTTDTSNGHNIVTSWHDWQYRFNNGEYGPATDLQGRPVSATTPPAKVTFRPAPAKPTAVTVARMLKKMLPSVEEQQEANYARYLAAMPPRARRELGDELAQFYARIDAKANTTELHSIGMHHVIKGAKFALEHPRIFGPAIGAMIGYGLGDSPEEKAAYAAAGAGMGLGAGFAGPALGRAAIDVVAPAVNRNQTLRTFITEYDGHSHQAAVTLGRNARTDPRFQEALRVIAEELAAGHITEAPARKAVTDALITFANSNGKTDHAKLLDDSRLNISVIRDNEYDGYTLSPRARAAFDVIDDMYRERLARDIVAKVLPTSVLKTALDDDVYQHRIWGEGPKPQPGFAIPGVPIARVGSKQGFQRKRTLASIQSGIAQGYTPLTLDPGSLLEARVASGEVAAANKKLLNHIFAQADWISMTPQAGYSTFDVRWLKKFYPIFNDKQLRQVLDNYERGLLTQPAAVKLIHKAAGGVGHRNIYIRDDIATQLDAYFGISKMLDTTAGRVTEQIFGTSRALRLGLDFAMLGRLVPMNWLALAQQRGPVRAGQAMVRAFGSLYGEGRERMLRNPNFITWQKAGLEHTAPGDLGEVLARPEGGLWIEQARIGKFRPGAVLEKTEKFQFERFVTALKFNIAEAYYEKLAKRSTLPEMELRRQIAARVNLTTSGYSRVRAGTGRTHEATLRMFMLSPNWARGALANLADVRKDNVEGMLARRFWTTMAVGGVSSVVGLNMLFTWDGSLDHLERMLDPDGEESVINPRSSSFMKVHLPADLGTMDLYGPVVPLARAIMTPVTAGVEKGVEGKGAWYDFATAIVLEAVSWEGTESLRDWAESRRSIPLGIALDVKENTDFRDRMISQSDDPRQRFIDTLWYIAGQNAPAIGEAGLDTQKDPLPDFHPSWGGAQRAVGGVLGLNVNTGTSDPDWVKAKVSAFLREQGAHPGYDPVGKFRSAQGLDPVAVSRFRVNNPDVLEFLDHKRDQRIAARPRLVGRDAANQFTQDRQKHAQIRNDTIKELGRQYTAGQLTGDLYREGVGKAWDHYFGAVDGAAMAAFKTTDTKEVNERLKLVYGPNNPRSSPVMQAFDDYHNIKIPPGKEHDPAARDAMAEERMAFLAYGADDRYGAGTGALLKERLRNDYVEHGGEVYGKYFDAQHMMGKYAQLTVYHSFLTNDREQERRVRMLLGRAQEMVRYGGTPSLLYAILTDPGADFADKIAAYRIVKAGPRAYSPARTQFLRDNAETMAPFYTNLLAEQVQAFA